MDILEASVDLCPSVSGQKNNNTQHFVFFAKSHILPSRWKCPYQGHYTSPGAATKHGMSAMMMAKTFAMIPTTHVHIIMFVTDIDFHGYGVEDYRVIDVGELCHLTLDVNSSVSDRLL